MEKIKRAAEAKIGVLLWSRLCFIVCAQEGRKKDSFAGHWKVWGQKYSRLLLSHFSFTENQRGRPGAADLLACPESEKELEGDREGCS